MLYLVSMRGQNRDISQFVTKFVGKRFMIYDYFHIKISLQFLAKSLLHNAQCLFTDHLKHKTVRKTCYMSTANPHQPCTH